MNAIRIDSGLSPQHDAILTGYLRGTEHLTREQWRHLREAIDLLARSTITLQGRTFTFKWFYETFIDRRFADAFLQALVATADVTQDAPLKQTPKGDNPNG
jgi:hypothetical protein